MTHRKGREKHVGLVRTYPCQKARKLTESVTIENQARLNVICEYLRVRKPVDVVGYHVVWFSDYA